MLRVRPLVYTSDLPSASAFLLALGLSPAVDPEPTDAYAVFDAGSGRVALQACEPGSAEEGTTSLAFDVSDVTEFARRTREAGTAVELSQEGHGLAARITAPDGTSFLADPGPRATTAEPTPLSVLALWYTPDLESAVRVLKDIGARPRISSDAGTWHDFSAKNGGLVALHAGERTGLELAFEYDGDVRACVGGLLTAGVEPTVIDESYGRSLRVPAPWGAEIWINERQRDLHGYTEH
ncbi:VOC family protein [Arthrobacter echini]|uniref:VOC family protein n=1 Tax=Arthrobacter echini TaxID=1529066 RepID=A0A4S5E304_9MICC|nr:VOC family protein [Arthrobacter echini]THJ65788.1 VOC family protein [Arthrobacter echini]